MRAPWDGAKALQRSLQDDALKIVMRGATVSEERVSRSGDLSKQARRRLRVNRVVLAVVEPLPLHPDNRTISGLVRTSRDTDRAAPDAARVYGPLVDGRSAQEVSGQQPKNELEAMVICQLAVTHALTMRSFGNLNRSNEIQQQDSNALAVARLTKAFALQVDALAKLGRGGERRVVVEHVHVYPGGQAIVGAVTHTGAPGALTENREQPHARDSAGLIIHPGKDVRSQNPEWEAVSVAGGEVAESLPNARRSTRVGRTTR